MSYVTNIVSGVICHLSGVRCHVSFFVCFYKFVDLVGGGSVINGADPVKFSVTQKPSSRLQRFKRGLKIHVFYPHFEKCLELCQN